MLSKNVIEKEVLSVLKTEFNVNISMVNLQKRKCFWS